MLFVSFSPSEQFIFPEMGGSKKQQITSYQKKNIPTIFCTDHRSDSLDLVGCPPAFPGFSPRMRWNTIFRWSVKWEVLKKRVPKKIAVKIATTYYQPLKMPLKLSFTKIMGFWWCSIKGTLGKCSSVTLRKQKTHLKINCLLLEDEFPFCFVLHILRCERLVAGKVDVFWFSCLLMAIQNASLIGFLTGGADSPNLP